MATTTDQVQEQVLDAVRRGQEMTLDAIKKVVETVSAAQAKLPAPFAGKLPTRTFAGKLPEFSSLPRPEAVVSSAFDFLGQFLAEQRKFADELMKATAALRPAGAGSAATESAATGSAATESGGTEPVGAEPGGTEGGGAEGGAAAE